MNEIDSYFWGMILDFGKLYKIDFIDHNKGKQDNVCLRKYSYMYYYLGCWSLWLLSIYISKDMAIDVALFI